MRLDHLELHQQHERTNWWWIARQRIILQVLEPHVRRRALQKGGAPERPLRLLDIGCGGGGFLEALSKYGQAMGVDAEPTTVEFARRTTGCEVCLGVLPDDIRLPHGSFDVVCALDVIEHVADDEAALRTIVDLLAPGGIFVCAVPAFGFLWSHHDVVNEHKRRYTRPELVSKIAAAGLTLERATYFNIILFPLIAAARMLRSKRNETDGADSPLVPRPVNAALTALFGSERFLLRAFDAPFGVSLLTLARKPEAA
ncbi:MAG: class I SAM-dependent methyltransferase [Pseudomonas sp.]